MLMVNGAFLVWYGLLRESLGGITDQNTGWGIDRIPPLYISDATPGEGQLVLLKELAVPRIAEEMG
jgi:hypothetical protein